MSSNKRKFRKLFILFIIVFITKKLSFHSRKDGKPIDFIKLFFYN